MKEQFRGNILNKISNYSRPTMKYNIQVR